MAEDRVKVDDRVWRKIKSKLGKDLAVYVGIQGNDKNRRDGTSNITVAGIHEFGGVINHPGGTAYIPGSGGARFVPNENATASMPRTGPHKIKIPERSFIRSTVREKNKQYVRMIGKILEKAMLTERAPKLALLGELAVSDIQAKIRKGIAPPLKAATKRRKKSSKPLIYTGQLINGITYEVGK